MSHTVNPELLSLANMRNRSSLEKAAVVPPSAAAPAPNDMGVMPPATPTQAAAAAAAAAPPPGDPTAAPAPPPGMMDPSMMGALPPAQPQPPAAAGGAGQKLKPEQMMQMLDFRIYNMQQILTAIANALGVQIDPSALVLPPGTTGAPAAEMALPGGPMAPAPQPPQGADPAAGGMPPDAGLPKAANWWGKIDYHAARIGRPVDQRLSSTVDSFDLQTKAKAASAICQNMSNHAD